MKKSSILAAALTIVFFASVFSFHTHPIKMGDFWWHLNTGRWIMEHGELPTEDPFTYTATEGPDSRKSVILKGYWLAQILYYLIYKHLGLQGLILFKAALFTAIFYALYRAVRRSGLPGITALMPIAPLVFLTDRFEEVRPQTFSFLGTILIYNCAEKTLRDLRGGARLGPVHFLPPCLIMFLWGNLHPGFIIGLGVLGVYALSETVKYILKKNALNRSSFGGFLIWSSAPVLASLLNPNHVTLLSSSLWHLFSSSTLKTIAEYKPPWEYAAFFNIPYTLFGLAALALLTLLVMALSWRRLELSHALLYCGFALSALSSFRFCMFFIIMSAAMAGGYLAALTDGNRKLLKTASTLVALLSIALMVSQTPGKSFITKGLAVNASLPEGAAGFINTHDLPEPLFNPYEWGGYLSWRLYPEYKVFLDARTLELDVHDKYKTAKLGRHRAVFEEYGIKTVVFYPINPVMNKVPGLIFSLLRDEGWRLVYLDRTSTVFQRKGALPLLPAIGKEILWDDLVSWFEYLAKADPGGVKHYIQLGAIYYARDDANSALRYFKKALEEEPGNKEADAWMDWLRKGRDRGKP
jgi:hypothetical protein